MHYNEVTSLLSLILYFSLTKCWEIYFKNFKNNFWKIPNFFVKQKKKIYFNYTSFTSWPPFRSQYTLIHAHTHTLFCDLPRQIYQNPGPKIQVPTWKPCLCTHSRSLFVSHPTFIRSLAGIEVPNPKSKYKTLIHASTRVVSRAAFVYSSAPIQIPKPRSQ